MILRYKAVVPPPSAIWLDSGNGCAVERLNVLAGTRRAAIEGFIAPSEDDQAIHRSMLVTSTDTPYQFTSFEL